MLLCLAVALLTVINVGGIVRSKIRLQTSADAAAKSAATWKARALNEISSLNCAIIGCAGLRLLIGNNPGWQGLINAQAASYSRLALEIQEKTPWQAEIDAYRTGYLTASRGQNPNVLPQKNTSYYPREDYGAFVFTDILNQGINLGLERTANVNQLLAQSQLGGGQLPGMALLQLNLSGNSFAKWQNAFSIKAVSWRRKNLLLVGPFLRRQLLEPAVSFSKATVTCDERDGNMALFVPHWRSILVRLNLTEDELSSFQNACQRTGLNFIQGKERALGDLIYH
jgi:hypothetical protein